MENFEVVIDRSNEFSAKYDEMDMKFGKKDVYSMWVADMDFEVAPVISEAIEKRAKQKYMVIQRDLILIMKPCVIGIKDVMILILKRSG